MKSDPACVLVIAVILSGCSFRELGRSIAEGAVDGFSSRQDSLVRVESKLIQIARDSVIGVETRKLLTQLVQELGDTLTAKAVALRDSLLSAYTTKRIIGIKDQLLGNSTKNELGEIRDELLGEKTRILLGRIRDELVGDSTRVKIAGLRNEILGASTRAELDSIIRSAIGSLSREYKAKMQPLIREEEGFLKKYTTEILWAAGGIIVIILVFAGMIFNHSRKYQRVASILSSEVEKIPEKEFRDRFVVAIQSRAKDYGVTTQLNRALKQ